MHDIKLRHTKKSLSLFHINACSLKINFYDLQHLLSSTKKSWHSGNKWNKNHKKVSLLNNLNLNNYSFELNPTRYLQVVLLSNKGHIDLNIYKQNEIESSFLEIVKPKKIEFYCGSHLQTFIYEIY